MTTQQELNNKIRSLNKELKTHRELIRSSIENATKQDRQDEQVAQMYKDLGIIDLELRTHYKQTQVIINKSISIK